MKYNRLRFFPVFILLVAMAGKPAAQSPDENNCFEHFNPRATGQHNINQYLISLVCRLTYPERLGSDMRRDRLRIPVADNAFEETLKERIKHWFYDPATLPEEPQFDVTHWNLLKAGCRSDFTDAEWESLEDLYYDATRQPRPALAKPATDRVTRPVVTRPFTDAKGVKPVHNGLASDPPLFKKTADGRIVELKNFTFQAEQLLKKRQQPKTGCSTVYANFLRELQRYKIAVDRYEQGLIAFEAALPRIHYVSGNSRVDPEAIFISTPGYIIIAFRGTDEYLDCYPQRDCQNRDQTELANLNKELMVPSMHRSIPGQLHSGWYLSASSIERDITDLINRYNGRNKKIWLAGHSKGAGEATILAAILVRQHNIPVQGLYTFGGVSSVGDETFANFLNAYFDTGTLNQMQRFEVIHDYVASSDLHLIPGGFKYKPSGTRCYYDGIDRNGKFFFARAERGPLSHLTEGEVALSFAFNSCQHIIDNYCRAAYFLLERTNNLRRNLPGLPPWHGNNKNTCTTQESPR